MGRWSGMAPQRSRRPLVTAVVLALAPLAAPDTLTAPHQVAAPYGLCVRRDCELTSAYSAGTKSTVVQLALDPPGPDGSPAAASLVLQAEYAGTRPGVAPAAITILALPKVTSNPAAIRGVTLELMIECADTGPIRLFYFGESWGEYGFVNPGGRLRGWSSASARRNLGRC